MDRDLFWYDIEKKEMLKFKGERLEFKYARDMSLPKPKFRLLPKVVMSKAVTPAKIKKVAQSLIGITIESEISSALIHKWFKRYQMLNPTDAEVDSTNRKSVDFIIPLDEAKDFVTNALKNGFTFEE